jgi:hypothetical protein
VKTLNQLFRSFMSADYCQKATSIDYLYFAVPKAVDLPKQED